MTLWVVLERRKPMDAAPLSFQTPQHPIGQPGTAASSQSFDLIHGLGDGGVCLHAIHIEDLVGAETKKIQEEGGDALKALLQVEVEEVIQSPPKPNGPIRCLLNPASIPEGKAGCGLIEGQIDASSPGNGPKD